MIPISKSSDTFIPLHTTGLARIMASTSQSKQITKPVDSVIKKARQCKAPVQQAQQASNESMAESAADVAATLAHNAIMPKGGNQIGLLSSDLASLKLKYFSTLIATLFASGEPFNDFLKMFPKFLETSHTTFKVFGPTSLMQWKQMTFYSML